MPAPDFGAVRGGIIAFLMLIPDREKLKTFILEGSMKIFLLFKKYLIPLTLLAIVLLFAGCSNTNSSTADATTQTSSNPSTTGSASESTSATSVTSSQSEGTTKDQLEPKEVILQMCEINGQLLLIPALGQIQNDIDQGIYTYYLAEDHITWLSAVYSVEKTDSITGRSFRDSQDSTYDIYQVSIGALTGYTVHNTAEQTANVQNELLFKLIQGQPVLLPESKEFAIAKVFDDLYAIDSNGKARMISSREIGPYNYAIIDKKGIGDLFAWEWTWQPVCSSENNTVYYLSSRGNEFYSIWKLDLDQNVEERFGEAVALSLTGVGSDWLIAVMNPDKSQYLAELIYVINPEIYTPFDENEWQSFGSWIYRLAGTNLILELGNTHVEVDAGIAYKPFYIMDDLIILAYIDYFRNMEFLALHLDSRTYSVQKINGEGTIDEWRLLMNKIYEENTSFDLAGANGIVIKNE
ncbi:MAG: hypothetical protein SCM11_00975 [Bacillota bacterium]|nr:hypothetical protein [Bacillota bacterium]